MKKTKNGTPPKSRQWPLILIVILSLSGMAAWYLNSKQKQNSQPTSQSVTNQFPVSASSFQATVPNQKAPPGEAPEGMVWIPGGEFSMGAEDPRGMDHGGPSPMEDARPIHRVYVDGFWMDQTEVTNKQFEQFVKTTGYKTIAELTPKAEDFPGAPPENLVAGSVVFAPTPQPVPLDNHYQWWTYIKGANWRHPEGPESNIKGKEKYPVLHIGYEDAVAYAKWARKRLPTEAEWEFAGRGGLTGKVYVWGNEFRPHGKWMANSYQGSFQFERLVKMGLKALGRLPNILRMVMDFMTWLEMFGNG